jgi:hypothetical protein
MEMKMKISAQFDCRLDAQQNEKIERVFHNYCESFCIVDAENRDVPLIPDRKLRDALKCVHSRDLGSLGASEIFRRTATAYSDRGLTIEEFGLACKAPTKVEEWLNTLNLPRLLAFCIPQIEDQNEDEELVAVSSLTHGVLDSVAMVFAEKVLFGMLLC